MIYKNILWWMVFCAIAICLQRVLPGIDVLVIGLLLALQERRLAQVVCVFVALVLLQEGVGTLDFGASLLWYTAVIGLFFIGHWLFETENFLFMFLLSGCLGAVHCGVIWLASRLQYIPLNMPMLLDESILQALFLSCVWKVAMMVRRWVVPHENTA